MCGIFGVYSFLKGVTVNHDLFEGSLKLQNHRGPDGTKSCYLKENLLALGHNRLSIIDLSEAASQPMFVDDYVIVFNGEIFNYIELRDELVNYGYKFYTTSDTEVLIRAYQYWGEGCVNRFNGMWAFSIYDSMQNVLFCSRDRFGVKPFNYAIVDDQFVFSSEIKAIINYFPKLKRPNFNVIANFCRTSTGAQIKETWFDNIFRLEPAHNITVSASGIKQVRYWDYPHKINKEITFPEAISKYRELLTDAVKIRMRSDVPIGFTLSSGIDSSSLVCLLKDKFYGNKHTYTAAFTDEKFSKLEKSTYNNDLEIDEPLLVRKLARELKLEPSIIEIDYERFFKDLENIVYHLESGHSSPAVFPLYQILKEAKKNVTVVVEGQGADELLGGYINSAITVYLLELLSKLRFKKAFLELKEFSKVYSLKMTFMLMVRQSQFSLIKKIYYRFSGLHEFFTGALKHYKEISDYPTKPSGFDNSLNKHLYKIHTGILANLLHYGDAIPMAHSLESRLPFMDYRLVEFAFTLPSEYKIGQGMGKIIHRQAMQNIVPDFIIKNPVKFGFNTPLSNLFTKEGESSPRSIMLSEKCLSRGFFSKQKLIKAFKEQDSGKKNHAYVLYRLFLVELWFRIFIDD